jgi:hypothetical protein
LLFDRRLGLQGLPVRLGPPPRLQMAPQKAGMSLYETRQTHQEARRCADPFRPRPRYGIIV